MERTGIRPRTSQWRGELERVPQDSRQDLVGLGLPCTPRCRQTDARRRATNNFSGVSSLCALALFARPVADRPKFALSLGLARVTIWPGGSLLPDLGRGAMPSRSARMSRISASPRSLPGTSTSSDKIIEPRRLLQSLEPDHLLSYPQSSGGRRKLPSVCICCEPVTHLRRQES